jgi:uncharacterized protein
LVSVSASHATHRWKSSHRRGALYRLMRYRFVIPMQRSHHPAEFAARGTALGVALAFTPTIGLHILIASTLWAVTARSERWHFSLILAIAWTWLSNPLTALPIYYALYVTGQLMLGHLNDLSGYADFITLWSNLTAGDHSLWQDVKLMAGLLLEDWGLAMAVGSIPWAIITGGLGYALSLRFIRAYRHERAVRRARRI